MDDTAHTSLHERVDHLMHIIDRDRYVAAATLTAVRSAMNGRLWLLEGRGGYACDDDDYRNEFKDAMDTIEQALIPLGRLAIDKSDCTKQEDRVIMARQAARDYLAQPIGPREMVQADLFGDPRDSLIADLKTASRTLLEKFDTLIEHAARCDIKTPLPEHQSELAALRHLLSD